MTTTIIRAACPHDCPDTCALLITVADAVFPDGTRPRAGDIMLVGMKDSDYGTHITVVESIDLIVRERTLT